MKKVYLHYEEGSDSSSHLCVICHLTESTTVGQLVDFFVAATTQSEVQNSGAAL
jgi:hypothetical protein